jgi:hypothetical protein
MDGATPTITCKRLCQKVDILLLTVELKITHLTVYVPHFLYQITRKMLVDRHYITLLSRNQIGNVARTLGLS